MELLAPLTFGAAVGIFVSIVHEFAAQGGVSSAATFPRYTIMALSCAVKEADWLGFVFLWFSSLVLLGILPVCFCETMARARRWFFIGFII